MAKHKKHRTSKKDKVPKGTATKIPSTPKETQEDIQKPQKIGRLIFFSKVKKVFWTFVALLGLAIGIYTFYPHVSIKETPLLQPYNPFYNPFEIRNTGNIRIINFSYDLQVSDLLTVGEDHFINFTAGGFTDTIRIIKVNGSHPINFARGIIMPSNYVKSAQIFIRYKYSIPIFKISFSDSTKFVLDKDFQNRYIWDENQY